MSNSLSDAVMERLDFIEFRQELLFNNTRMDRSIFEYGLTRSQYHAIMDVMDEYRKLIDNGQACSHHEFENKIYVIVPSRYGDYHMCEELAKGFMEEGSWEEVFITLYGDMSKFAHIKKRSSI